MPLTVVALLKLTVAPAIVRLLIVIVPDTDPQPIKLIVPVDAVKVPFLVSAPPLIVKV